MQRDDRSGDRLQREGEPVVGVRHDEIDEKHRREVTAVRWEPADVDPRVLDLPPARMRRPRITDPARDQRNRIGELDRKSTRLNSSHLGISYAVFCLKKKKTKKK